MNASMYAAVLLAAALYGGRLLAQASRACPDRNGVAAAFTWGDSAGAPGAAPSGRIHLDQRTVIDTVWRFQTAERRWTRAFFAGSIGAGWSGGMRGTGTTTARDSVGARTWSACASAAITMREPTLVLRGARGVVRLRANVGQLSRIGQARPDSSRERK
jgi:hypothetical protein